MKQKWIWRVSTGAVWKSSVSFTDRYYETLIQRFSCIAEAPYKYQSVDHIRESYRRSVCGVDSIYYRMSGDVIEIMRVLGRQDAGERL